MGFLVEDKAPARGAEEGRRGASSSCRASPTRTAIIVIRSIAPNARNDRGADPLVDRQPLPGADGHADGRRLGRGLADAHAARRAAGSLRHAGHHPHALSRAGAEDRRGPAHLPARHHHDVGAGREDGARVLDVRRLLRVHPVRGRHRPLLGALARARVSEPGAVAPARVGEARARPRRHRRGLDLPVRAGRSQRPPRPGRAARAAGLVPALRAQSGRRRGRGRLGRRHGAPVPDRALSRAAARLRHPARTRDPGGAERQPRDRRLGARARRGRVHGARERLPQDARGLRRDPAHHHATPARR